MNNPYRPSNAALKDSPARQAPRSPLVAVAAGLAVDIGGTLAASVAIAIVYTVVLASRGTAPDDIQAALTQASEGSRYVVITAVMGIGFSVLGGYVCARMVRRNELRVATIQALLLTALGVMLNSDAAFDWSVFVTFAAVLLGGALGRRRNLATAAKVGGAA